jgi:hypothetical protein
LLSEAAQRRLVQYCRRAAVTERDLVLRNVMRSRRHVPYVNEQLRRIVWADEEVRDALLVDENAEGLAAVLERHRCPRRLDLLDLMCAMTLEAELVGAER